MIRRTKSLLLKPVARRAQTKLQERQHGRHIFAYCHMQTKQVLYSLERVMNNNDMLKQFPDAGANNTPRALRKDLWRPFFILSMPEGERGMAQGLMAFRQLREWRKLHEVSWEVSPLLARPHSEEEIEAMQEKLDNRGGSKGQNVWDLIKRAKKKMRQHTVMDQKANSVADLAAVLKDMEKSGIRIKRENMKELKADREKEVEKMLRLARRHEGGAVKKLAEKIADIESQLEKPASEMKGTSKTILRSRLYQLRSLEKQMHFAAEAVSRARKGESAPLLVNTSRKNTQKEDAELHTGVEQLVHHLGQRLQMCSKLRSAQIPLIDAEIEELQKRGVSPDRVRHLLYEKKVCESVGDIADRIWSVYEEFDIVELSSLQQSNTLTLQQMSSRTRDSTIELLKEVRKLAEDEIALEKDRQESGWAFRVHDLEKSLHSTAADLKTTRAMRSLAIKTLEANKNSPPSELHPDAESVAEGNPSPEQSPVSLQASSDVATEKVKPPPKLENTWHEFLPSFPTRDANHIPKRGEFRRKLDRLARPIFSARGVSIRWENVLDAEYAESWPRSVAHKPMGYARHLAPKPQVQPIQGYAEQKAYRAERASMAGGRKNAKEAYLEGLQEEILEKMRSKAFAEQDAADLITERESRRLIKNVGLHKKAVKRRREKEREEAAAKDSASIEAPIDA